MRAVPAAAKLWEGLRAAVEILRHATLTTQAPSRRCATHRSGSAQLQGTPEWAVKLLLRLEFGMTHMKGAQC